MKTSKALRKASASLLKRFFILFSGGYSVGTAYGSRFLFDWRHSLDKKVALGLYEQEQVSYLKDIAKQLGPHMFLDIGAHAALYSVVLKTLLPRLEVHAFEPDRTNLCQLYANLFVNRLTQEIRVHEFGLSNQAGTASFDTSEETSSRGTRRISGTGNTQIEIKRLDDVLAESGKVVMFKIDVEGHEWEVIDGARNFLEANHCFLQIESSAEKLPALTELLGGLGYTHVHTIGGHDRYFSNIASIVAGQRTNV